MRIAQTISSSKHKTQRTSATDSIIENGEAETVHQTAPYTASRNIETNPKNSTLGAPSNSIFTAANFCDISLT
jgi:hypothetical protein